jgi:hypothetical protein
MTVQPQPPYRVVVTHEHRSRRTNRTLHDEANWIGSLVPVPTKNEFGRVVDVPDSPPYRVDDARF